MIGQEDEVQGFFNKQSEKWSQTYYESDGTMKPRIQRFIAAITNYTELVNRNLIDIGCGTGELARACASERAKVSACDLSSAMLKAARTLDENQQVNWIQAVDGTKNTGRIVAPVEDETQDIVTLSSVLEYVTDLPGSLTEIARSLKTGGYTFATVPNPNHPSRAQEPFRIAVMQYALVRFIVKRVPRLAAYELAYHSCNRMAFSEWKKAYRLAGLTVLDYQEPEEQSLWMIVAKKEA